jgi:DNA repair exonuclease SbcCD ATPase subunit
MYISPSSTSDDLRRLSQHMGRLATSDSTPPSHAPSHAPSHSPAHDTLAALADKSQRINELSMALRNANMKIEQLTLQTQTQISSAAEVRAAHEQQMATVMKQVRVQAESASILVADKEQLQHSLAMSDHALRDKTAELSAAHTTIEALRSKIAQLEHVKGDNVIAARAIVDLKQQLQREQMNTISVQQCLWVALFLFLLLFLLLVSLLLVLLYFHPFLMSQQ